MARKVAIVGCSYRFPGTSRDRYWSDLTSGSDLVSKVESGRWAQETYLHPKKSHPGTAYTFAAGSLGDVSTFDAAFFGISPREAAQMDPQQRLLLEMSWEAFENAGIRPVDVRGGRCGVFIGIASADYSYRFAEDLGVVDSSVATGNTSSIAANRISYLFDLRGPSMAIDTACSSSLVAFHQACRSIASGETSMALAGGVSLHLHPYGFIVFSKASMLSPRGRCNVFDASGDGYVRSEGGGIFLLKDYDQARADGDRILAVVAASAVNTDGRKTGLTIPSGRAQADLLREAYALAGIDASDIDYIEAHGTGTAVGDPIETRALGEALGQSRPKGKPLLIGSVKSNMGHLETASGVAGLVKAIHCIQHRQVPATIHLKNPNPKIKFEEWNLQVARANTPLKPQGRLVVGVNSFGFGGANAHVVLTSPEDVPSGPVEAPVGQAVPLVISGKTEGALRAAAGQMAAWLEEGRGANDLYGLGYNLAFRRELHGSRAVLFAEDAGQVAGALARLAAGDKTDGLAVVGSVVKEASAPAFIYSGNGSQWEGMGRQLLADPVFLAAIREVDALFRPLAGYSLEDELAGCNGSGRYEWTEIAQPALFAVQVGVTAMLRARGVKPAAVAGHSVGEVAAAWASGSLTLAQAVQVIFHRSAQQGQTKGRGQMTAVGLGEEACRALLAELGLEDSLAVAGVNSSRGVTVAGEPADLERLEAALGARKAMFKRLALDYAFHSPAMDPIESGVRTALADLRPVNGQIGYHSTVTGGVLPGESLVAAYWWDNIRKPVLFQQAIEGMLAAGINVFVEVGPHAVLRGYINDALRDAGKEGRVVPSLARNDDAPERVREAVGQLLVAGAPLDWQVFFPRAASFVELPTYPWQRERHWHDVTSESVGLLQRHKVHPLLGYRLAQKELAWENQLDTALNPSLKDHVVGDAVVFPGTGYAELALAAAQQWLAPELVEISDLEIRTPLLLGEDHAKSVRLRIDAADGGFSIRGRQYAGNEPWAVHAVGRLGACAATAWPVQAAVSLPQRAPDFDGADHGLLTDKAGLAYGPAYRAVSHGWIDGDEVWAVLQAPAAIAPEVQNHHLHPALLDCTFQLIIHLLAEELAANEGVAYVPTRIGRLVCRSGNLQPRMAKARLLRRSPHSLTVEFTLFDEAGVPVAWVHEARFRSIRLQKHQGEHIRLLGYADLPQPHPLQGALPVPGLYAAAAASLGNVAQVCVEQGSHKRYGEELEPLLDSLCELFAKGADAAGDDSEGLTAAEVWNGVLAEYSDHFSILQAVGRTGLHLGELVPGSAAGQFAAEKLWPRLAGDILGAPARRAVGDALRQVIAAGLAKLPAGQRFRIVEVGSCAPVFAPDLCRGLDFDRCDFVLAADARSLDACQRLQEQFPGLAVKTVESLAAEGQGDFHLAIASGAYGVETGSAEALAFARRALLPDGVLLFAGIAPTRWADFVFIDDAAWWVEGEDGKRYSRHRPAAWWRQYSEDLGFADVRLLSFAEGSESGPYLLIGRGGVVAEATGAAGTQPRNWILLAQDFAEKNLAAELAGGLEAAGEKVLCSPAASVDELESLLREARTRWGGVDGIIHLRGLGGVARGDFASQLAAQVDRCTLAAALVQACEASGTNATLWLVTANGHGAPTVGGETDAPLWGFGRTLMNEASGYGVRLLDLGATEASESLVAAMLTELLHPTPEEEVVLTREGGRFVPRLRLEPSAELAAVPVAEATAFRLGFQFPGQLRNLRWEAAPAKGPGEGEVEIEVRATGLNFRDVMYALGLLSDEAVENGFAGPTLGLECAGVVSAVGPSVKGVRPGDRVVAFGPSCFSNRIVTQAAAVAGIPGDISFEAAATIPSTFFTAYYALHHLARLQEGERVLIHGAAGGVGIAAIQIAKWCGAEIFATAGSDEKRDFLRLLGVDHIFDSRSLAFSDQILAITGGVGVDVVLNSLAGEAISHNFRVLRPFGRFLELGKRDFYENTKIGLRPFRNNISYFGIDADQLMAEQPALTGRLFGEVMALFAEGQLHPLPYCTFEAEDVVDAFRHMQQARQIGKIVVTYGNGIPALHAARAERPAIEVSADASYLVTGGLRGFGLKTAQWLAAKGARHLVLISRSGPVDEEAKHALADLAAAGVRVLAAACDITDGEAMDQLFERMAREMPPLRGMVHAAVVIDDGLVRGLDRARIEKVLAPKILGVMHLDRLTRSMPLDFFVLFSSATTLFGNPGQASYVAANAWLESFAASRRAAGLPALCVRWGAIDDAGFLARHADIKEALQGRMGGAALKTATALAELDALLAADRSGLGVLDLDWRALSRFLPSAGSPKFSELARQGGECDGEEDRADDIQRLVQELSGEELAAAFVQMLKEEVGEILRIEPAKIDENRSIYDMGLDSLMGVELVTAVESRFGVRLPVMALSESPSIAKLAEKLIGQLKAGGGGEGEDAAAAVKGQVEQVVHQHGVEVDAKTIGEFVEQLQNGVGASARMID